MGGKKATPVKKSLTKPVLLQETAFEKARKWADKNHTLVFGAGAAILFTIIFVYGYTSLDRSKQARAQSDYGLLASKFPAEGKASPAEDWEKLIPDLQKFISGHEATAPALNARIELAKAFFETKRYTDAAKTGEEALKLAPAGYGLRPLIMYQLAYAYESAEKNDEASRMWTKLKELGLPELEREADWNLGRILEGKKDFQKAEEMYRLASQAPGDYPPAALIDQQIAGIKAGQATVAKSEEGKN